MDDAVIVDPKVVTCFTGAHIAQMIGYLNITGFDLVLLLNFKNSRLEWKRVYARVKLVIKALLIFMPNLQNP